ncbi:hypothetical protein HD806DRAFT_517313 [Xylariaceae sp. AK1471]|nr:hypothetical protein HD806DRAFT_517313 [Xylariaceae sp. AK1471]
MHNNAMRWLSRLKGPIQGVQSLVSYDSGRIFFGRTSTFPRPAGPHFQVLPLSRGLCSSPRLQTSATSSSPKASSSAPTQHPTSGQAHNSKPQGPRWTLLALISAASAGAAYLYRRQSGSSDDDVINTSSFSAFTITKREQVSPTAFIITLRPSAWVDQNEPISGDVEEDDSTAGFYSKRIQDAWRHGLWSVEIKQPQLQIARHYTPLPPPPTPPPSSVGENGSEKSRRQHEEEDLQADLRILIRRMDGGEMSNYLSRQYVGDTVWLRGPHLGFDVTRRLGAPNCGGPDGDTRNGDIDTQKGVVFLAGGTGIAPALQIAHRLLDGDDSSDYKKSKPHISILWANRWGADALGREQFPSPLKKSTNWFGFWGNRGSNYSPDIQEEPKQVNDKPFSSLALQIQDTKQRHGSHFQISYFVDDEESFIKAHNLEAAIASTSAPTDSPSSSAKIDKNCTWHSAKAVELLPDDNDAARSSSSSGANYECICTSKAGAKTAIARPGVNLLCVSGPDGFISAYVGAKRWHEGNEMQGTVGGLLGKIQENNGDKVNEWLVLKL